MGKLLINKGWYYSFNGVFNQKDLKLYFNRELSSWDVEIIYNDFIDLGVDFLRGFDRENQISFLDLLLKSAVIEAQIDNPNIYINSNSELYAALEKNLISIDAVSSLIMVASDIFLEIKISIFNYNNYFGK